MNPLGPILAVTDFSAGARHAVHRAARLAHASGAPLTLMHVLPDAGLQELRGWLGVDSDAEQRLQADARQQLQQLANDVQAHRHVAVHTRTASGAPLTEIMREAQALDAALLVTGARGASFLRRLVMGTTSERLLRLTTRPLLVVRQTAHEPYQRVLLALDFSPWSVTAATVARQVAPHAHFVLLHAFQVPFEEKLRFASVDAETIERYRRHAHTTATERVHALALAAGLNHGHWTPCIVEGDASLRIVEQEQAQDCDLVVLGKHGQSATEDLLLGSVTKHVLAEGSADVLVSTARTEGDG